MDGITNSGVIGIIVTSIVGFIVIIGGIMYLFQRNSETAPRTLAIMTGGKTLYYFIPYSLFLFGVIYDMINGKIKYFPAGFVGLLAVFLNYLTSSFLYSKELFLQKDLDICGIPGLSTLWSRLSPQNILFSSTVLSYITFTNVTNDPGSLSATLSGIALLLVFLLQFLMYYLNKCGTGSNPIYFLANNEYFFWIPPVWALAGGLLFGGLFGWLITTFLVKPDEEKK